jgi:hypothetical protein
VIVHVYSVSLNSPKHRVRKQTDGLWHAYRSGRWVAAYGSWSNAMRCAADGVVW